MFMNFFSYFSFLLILISTEHSLARKISGKVIQYVRSCSFFIIHQFNSFPQISSTYFLSFQSIIQRPANQTGNIDSDDEVYNIIKLRDFLLTNPRYDRLARPVKHHSTTVQVSAALFLSKITELVSLLHDDCWVIEFWMSDIHSIAIYLLNLLIFEYRISFFPSLFTGKVYVHYSSEIMFVFLLRKSQLEYWLFKHRFCWSVIERQTFLNCQEGTNDFFLSLLSHSFVLFHQKWKDEHLVWDSNKFGGITKLVFGFREIWTPEITHWNSFDSKSYIAKTFDRQSVDVKDDGTVEWFPTATLKSYCSLDLKDFPTDTQTCHQYIGTWNQNTSEVNFVEDPEYTIHTERIQGPIFVSKRFQSQEWDPVNLYMERYEIHGVSIKKCITATDTDFDPLLSSIRHHHRIYTADLITLFHPLFHCLLEYFRRLQRTTSQLLTLDTHSRGKHLSTHVMFSSLISLQVSFFLPLFHFLYNQHYDWSLEAYQSSYLSCYPSS